MAAPSWCEKEQKRAALHMSLQFVCQLFYFFYSYLFLNIKFLLLAGVLVAMRHNEKS